LRQFQLIEFERRAAAIAALYVLLAPGAAGAKDTRFWNLTASTITSLQLSPVGKNDWGANQAANDSDGSVDHDERLKILGVASGVYDLRYVNKAGRTCIVKSVTVKQGAVFSIDEKSPKICTP
jgi:hypothetical protein